jgi:hypothetical protein
MGKWWHILATIGLAALAAAIPPIQGVLLAHPYVSGVLGVVWTVLGNLLQSPLPPKQ